MIIFHINLAILVYMEITENINTSQQQAYSICLEMLEQRGYSIESQEPDQIIAIKPDGNQMIVFFLSSSKFTVDYIKNMVNTLQNELYINHAIVVYKDSVTYMTKKFIENIPSLKIELFPEINLQYNITKHVLQPLKYEKLDDKEAEVFKKKYGVKFPVQKQTGEIALFYGYEKGDVIRVTRRNGLVEHRIVK